MDKIFNINWTVRFKNPVFLANLAASVVMPILVYMGLSWNDMTTWAALGNVFVEAIKNPVIMTSVAVSVWNAVNDPTTAGVTDSKQALTYTEPKKQ